MSDKTLYKLVNPSFTFEFGGTTFEVKKANLEMAIKYQERIKELKDSKNAELQLAAYCIYLVLREVDDTVSEDWVIKNAPADLDFITCLGQLGFMSQEKVEMAQKINQEIEKRLISGDFSVSSPKEQDGHLQK